MTLEKIFSGIYERKEWGEGSGGGTDAGVTGPWAKVASDVILLHGFRRIVSIGCGDGIADRDIRLYGADYLGIDCVPSIIKRARANFVARRFEVGSRPDLYHADLYLLKEVTQHLSNNHVRALLSRCAGASILHCSATTGPVHDIKTGGYRPVWLDREPFNLKTTRLAEWEYATTAYQIELLEAR